MDTAARVKPAKGRSLPPPPPLSSSSDGVKEMQLLAKTADAGERNMNNLLEDDNHQKLNRLTERLNSLADGQSSSPSPSPFSAVKEKQLLRNVNNLLLEDENNQKLDDLTERLSSLGGENTTASARATSALRESTRHNAQAKKEGPRVSKLKKRKRVQPADENIHAMHRYVQVD